MPKEVNEAIALLEVFRIYLECLQRSVFTSVQDYVLTCC